MLQVRIILTEPSNLEVESGGDRTFFCGTITNNLRSDEMDSLINDINQTIKRNISNLDEYSYGSFTGEYIMEPDPSINKSVKDLS